MIEIQEYIDVSGKSQFGRWYNKLDTQAALKIRTYLARIEAGNFSNTKSVGSGVLECKINYGPGYRVYFGKDGERLVILLGGGTKKRQSNDIANATALWQQYKTRR